MNVSVKSAGSARVKSKLKKWSGLTGKGVQDGVEMMARTTAKNLAGTVQPYGLGGAKADKFVANIGRQVTQVWIGVNYGVYPLTGSFEQTYNGLRRRGRIPTRKIRGGKGARWLDLVPRSELDRLVKKQQAKAGRAKAAWIDAGNRYGAGKIRKSKGAEWIWRHVGSGYGSADRKRGRGIGAKIGIQNRTPYINKLQTTADLSTGVKRGRKNSQKALERAILAQQKKLKQ